MSSGQKQSIPDGDSIESDYSHEDFENPSMSGSLKRSVRSNKKLQGKAKDIEGSNAYSETFEEESLAKSSKFNVDESKDKKNTHMTIVKEESIDESIMTQSKVSQSAMSND